MPYQFRYWNTKDRFDRVLFEGSYVDCLQKAVDYLRENPRFEQEEDMPDRWCYEKDNYEAVYIVPSTEPVYDMEE